MVLEITGKLLQKLDIQSGSGNFGNWKRQDAIIETIEQYPKKICISFWNEKIGDIDRVNLGDTVMVSVNIESRENNGRWYTSVRVWKLQLSVGEANQQQATVARQNSYTPQDIPAPANSDFLDVQSTEIDDLPF